MYATYASSNARDRAAPPPSPANRLVTEPSIVLVAPPSGSEGIRSALARAGTRILVSDDATRVPELIGPSTVAIVLGDVREPQQMLAALENLRHQKASRRLPVFAIGGDDVAPETVTALYDRGAAAVFSWPTEALTLAPLLVEMLDVTLRIQEERPVDVGLQDLIEARLELEGASSLQVTVHDCRVTLEGRVDSSWQRRRLADLVAATPGVRAVDAESLTVDVPTVPDFELERLTLDVLRSAAGTHPATLAVSVDDGVVTVAGTAATRAELERIENVIHNLHGVRDVRNLVTVSRRAALEGRDTARKLRSRISYAFPQAASLRVSCFGHVVVLEGTVPSLADRRSIEMHIRHDYAVDRVVNKLSVR